MKANNPIVYLLLVSLSLVTGCNPFQKEQKPIQAVAKKPQLAPVAASKEAPAPAVSVPPLASPLPDTPTIADLPKPVPADSLPAANDSILMATDWRLSYQSNTYAVNEVLVSKKGDIYTCSMEGVQVSPGGKGWKTVLPGPCRSLSQDAKGTLYVIKKRTPYDEKNWVWDGELWQSSDGGENWTLFTLPDNAPLKEQFSVSYYCVDLPRELLYVANDHRMWKVNLGNKVLETKQRWFDIQISDMKVTQSGMLWVICGNYLLASANSGENLEPVLYHEITKFADNNPYAIQMRTYKDWLFVMVNGAIHMLDEKGHPFQVFQPVVNINGKDYGQYSPTCWNVNDGKLLVYEQHRQSILQLYPTLKVVSQVPPVEAIGQPTGLVLAPWNGILLTTEGIGKDLQYQYATKPDKVIDYTIYRSQGSLFHLPVFLLSKNAQASLTSPR